MTRTELDERIDNLGGSLEDKIDYVESWMFDIEMIDRWDNKCYQIMRLLHDKLQELKKLKAGDNYRS